MLSAQTQAPTPWVLANSSAGVTSFASSAPPDGALPPGLIRQAYGFDQIAFGGIQGDATGQTIAIIDPYDSPTISTDLQTFDTYYGLPAPPSFTRIAQDGSTNYPSTDPAGAGNHTWELETSLDVEWAHALAPNANILLVEASSPFRSDLFVAAVNEAKSWPGLPAQGNRPAVPPASVVSMSFGNSEFAGEGSYDSLFTTPSGHIGITFVAGTGDSGQPAAYPAFSPNVVAVGGTNLSVDGSGNYLGETGWSGSGGGVSTLEPQPTFQNGVVTPFSSSMRTAPDVAFDAGSYVSVCDSWDYGTSTPWVDTGGTSFATPAWAALISIADQARVAAGLSTLDGATQTLPELYSLPSADFNDITTGNNGFNAGPGYDLVTGLGTPQAPLVVTGLVGAVASSIPAAGSVVSSPPTDFTITFASRYTPSTIAANDLTVNAVAADSFTLINSTTVTFHYNTSPVSQQGLQIMSIAAGAITWQSDGARLAAFNASFRYDVLPIAVDISTPANGSVVALPLSTLTLHFNEAYAPSSISAGNLTLSQGVVSGYSFVDSQTVAYALSGISKSGTLTINMAAGAVTDVFGNPGPAYSGTLHLNNPPVAFPAPLASVAPAGSLIYENSASGSINPGSTDSYILILAAGQTLSLVVNPAPGLQAQLGLSGPGLTTSATATSVGVPATLGSVAIDTTGNYTLTVAGLNGSTGGYTLQADLNAALSAATVGGATSHSRSTAQNIDPSFVNLAGTAQRGAVMGRLPRRWAPMASATAPNRSRGSSTISVRPVPLRLRTLRFSSGPTTTRML